MKKNSNAQSTLQTKETVTEVKQRCDTTEEQANKRLTLYRVPHARTPITSNGKDEGLRTYSRIPLHLRNNVPIRIPQKTHADNRSDNNADLNGKVTEKKPPKQALLGQQIHTPGSHGYSYK